MATITKQQAAIRLAEAVKKASPDDLVEAYNELFPEEPATEREANVDPATLVEKIAAHIGKGLEVQEVLDLWNVIFPKHRRIWFDEDTGMIHYDAKIEPVGQAD